MDENAKKLEYGNEMAQFERFMEQVEAEVLSHGPFDILEPAFWEHLWNAERAVCTRMVPHPVDEVQIEGAGPPTRALPHHVFNTRWTGDSYSLRILGLDLFYHLKKLQLLTAENKTSFLSAEPNGFIQARIGGGIDILGPASVPNSLIRSVIDQQRAAVLPLMNFTDVPAIDDVIQKRQRVQAAILTLWTIGNEKTKATYLQQLPELEGQWEKIEASVNALMELEKKDYGVVSWMHSLPYATAVDKRLTTQRQKIAEWTGVKQ